MKRGIRVLIVDDVPEVRHGLHTLLPLLGETLKQSLEIVGEAGNGHEAIDQSAALNPEVVLMDLEMPEMDGYAATRAIKARHPSIADVALTVHSDPESRRKAREAGVDELIEKGAPTSLLVQAIQRAHLL